MVDVVELNETQTGLEHIEDGSRVYRAELDAKPFLEGLLPVSQVELNLKTAAEERWGRPASTAYLSYRKGDLYYAPEQPVSLRDMQVTYINKCEPEFKELAQRTLDGYDVLLARTNRKTPFTYMRAYPTKEGASEDTMFEVGRRTVVNGVDQIEAKWYKFPHPEGLAAREAFERVKDMLVSVDEELFKAAKSELDVVNKVIFFEDDELQGSSFQNVITSEGKADFEVVQQRLDNLFERATGRRYFQGKELPKDDIRSYEVLLEEAEAQDRKLQQVLKHISNSGLVEQYIKSLQGQFLGFTSQELVNAYFNAIDSRMVGEIPIEDPVELNIEPPRVIPSGESSYAAKRSLTDAETSALKKKIIADEEGLSLQESQVRESVLPSLPEVKYVETEQILQEPGSQPLRIQFYEISSLVTAFNPVIAQDFSNDGNTTAIETDEKTFDQPQVEVDTFVNDSFVNEALIPFINILDVISPALNEPQAEDKIELVLPINTLHEPDLPSSPEHSLPLPAISLPSPVESKPKRTITILALTPRFHSYSERPQTQVAESSIYNDTTEKVAGIESLSIANTSEYKAVTRTHTTLVQDIPLNQEVRFDAKENQTSIAIVQQENQHLTFTRQGVSKQIQTDSEQLTKDDNKVKTQTEDQVEEVPSAQGTVEEISVEEVNTSEIRGKRNSENKSHVKMKKSDRVISSVNKAKARFSQVSTESAATIQKSRKIKSAEKSKVTLQKKVYSQVNKQSATMRVRKPGELPASGFHLLKPRVIKLGNVDSFKADKITAKSQSKASSGTESIAIPNFFEKQPAIRSSDAGSTSSELKTQSQATTSWNNAHKQKSKLKGRAVMQAYAHVEDDGKDEDIRLIAEMLGVSGEVKATRQQAEKLVEQEGATIIGQWNNSNLFIVRKQLWT
jgi:hypothetical protein